MVAYIQDLRSGQNVTTVNMAQRIFTNRWYHWHIQALGGSNGYAKFWLDGALVMDFEQPLPDTNITDHCEIDCGFYYGGGPGSAGLINSYGRNDNVWVYTGQTRPRPRQ
jgi:hypothetical protein